MARNNAKVLLGYEDELITEKYKNQVNFTTNKIGGKPDLPSNVKLDTLQCPHCHLSRIMVMQIYAPLETAYQRTLYLFACLNPNCWTQSESWICIRIQSQESVTEATETHQTDTSTSKTTDWCADADDWDDDDNKTDNFNEENGNLINFEQQQRVSDEDDESCSFEESLRCGFGNLTVADDRNANSGALGGAVGRLHSPSATAEIEGDEGEVITIDSPTVPKNDIIALLNEVPPLPYDLSHNTDPRKVSLQFTPYFMSVWEETSTTNLSSISDRHVKELLQDYQMKNEDDLTVASADGGAASAQTDNNYEKYEKSQPAHGDKTFHHFLSKLQMNPGQILRYCRDVEGPLLMYPMQEVTKKCDYCKADLVFELQILPTLIPKLKLIGTDGKAGGRLEFGNVLVYTCRNSCWMTGDHFRYETIVVQYEIY